MEEAGVSPASNRWSIVRVERNSLDVVHVLLAIFVDDGIVQ